MRFVILLSGGLDSATSLAKYSKKGYEIISVTFDYGQRNRFEIECAKQLSNLYNVKEHILIPIDSSIFNSSCSLNSDKEMDKFEQYVPNKGFVPNTYLPSRNIIFLSYAAGIAESRNINKIIFSCNKQDKVDYPDCGKSFIKSFIKTINKGTNLGKKSEFKIITPFINKAKTEIISLAIKLKVDLSKTQTCYDPMLSKKPCLKCDACLLRKSSFEILKIIDPLEKI